MKQRDKVRHGWELYSVTCQWQADVMKVARATNAALVLMLVVLWQDAQGQGFVNLDFENAVIILDTSSPFYPNAVYASDAIPGWTAIGFIGPNDIYYNNLTLGAPCVSIVDTNGSFHSPPIDGTYSIVLFGGSGSASKG